jgi:GDPmannose 4,6-dehydratase
MWKMLQQETPKDYVLATGVSHSVRELVNVAALAMDMPKPGEEYVEVVPSLIRPAEIWRLVGDTLPARQGLGWEAKVGFEELIGIMAEADLARLGMPPVTIRKPYTELEAWSASGPSTAE